MDKLMTLREWQSLRVRAKDMLVATVPEEEFNSSKKIDEEELPVGMSERFFYYSNLIEEPKTSTANTKSCYVSVNSAAGSSLWRGSGRAILPREFVAKDSSGNSKLKETMIFRRKLGDPSISEDIESFAHSPRSFFLRNLSRNGFKNQYNRFQIDYRLRINKLLEHKFTVCPTGYWKESHATYETLYCKGIPILNHDDLLREKHKGLPILWTWHYADITEDYLKQKYSEALDKVFDFSKLFLSSYSGPEQDVLVKRMLFRTSRKDWENIYKR